MKVVILAGGKGTRLSEFTKEIPKPMVPIGGIPIIWHIMNYYAKFNITEFIVSLGYKGHIIKEYFNNYPTINSDFTVNLQSGLKQLHGKSKYDWNVTLVDTGQETLTAGRLRRIEEYVNEETFMMTYGDGLSNVNISKLHKFHISHGKHMTMTGVHPPARFGELEIDRNDNSLIDFEEKPQLQTGWINGGFFVLNKSIFKYLKADNQMLEREPIQNLVKENQIKIYKHEGFWKCMDNRRDYEQLNNIWLNDAPWKY